MQDFNSEIFDLNNSFVIKLNNNLFNNLNNNLFNIILDQNNNNIIINILNNIILNKPIYLINNNFNIIINSGENNKFALIDHKNNLDYKNNQNNSTIINCEANTEIDYYLIQSNNISKINITQKTNSKFTATVLANNFTNNQLNLEINLIEQYATVYLNILQNTKKSALNNINLLINHLNILCSSYTVTRTIASDHSIANIIGRVFVDQHANKTIADLQSKSLILSKHATVNSCPELDIYNNDLVCTHGSSVGNLDQEALFYMQTRGINLEEAKQILLQAFIQPIIKNIKYPEIFNLIC